MGFMSASVGLTRYRIVEEDIPSSLWHEVEDRLKRNSFRDIDASAEERSFGWVSFDNMLDPDFILCPPEKGPYLTFTLRLDTRRVPPAVMKKHFAVAVNTPTLTILGATSSGWRFPSDAHHDIFEDMPCRPCNQNTCARKDHACLENLSPDRVADRVLEILSAQASW